MQPRATDRVAPGPKANKWLIAAGCLLLLGAAFAVRFVRLDSDPPHGLSSYSKGVYTDEGLKYYSARNRALFGSWSVKTPKALQGPYRTSPVPTAIGAFVFRTFGDGVVRARMISVVSGGLCCLLLVLIGVREDKPIVGFLAGFLAAGNFIFVCYNRLALFESPMLLFCLCALYCYVRGGKAKFIGAPVFLLLAFFTRASALALWAALAADFLLEIVRGGTAARGKRFATTALIALVVLALAAAVIFILPGNPISRQFSGRQESVRFSGLPAPLVASDLVLRTFSDSLFAEWMPLLLIAALLGGVLAFRNAGSGGHRGTFVFFLWFAASFAFVALLDYRPTRYYVMLLPAACYLAADWIVALAVPAGERAVPGKRFAIAVNMCLAIALAFAASVLVRFVIEHRHELLMFADYDAPALRRLELAADEWLIGRPPTSIEADAESVRAAGMDMLRHLASFAVVGALLLALVELARRVLRRILPPGLADRLRLVAAVLIGVVIVAGQVALAHRNFGRTEIRYEVRRGRSLIEYFVGDRPDACIGGNWAPTMCMGTPYFTFPLVRGNSNAWDTFKRFPVTHLLLEETDPAEHVFMWQTYPEEMARCAPLVKIEVDVRKLVLYEYHAPEGAKRPPWPMGEALTE
ncbi:MAG: ArnT family glycosyltransferase [Planctomycetota bacterium]